MKVEDAYAVYDNKDKTLVSVHPFRYLAVEAADLLNNTNLPTVAMPIAHRYISGQLIDALGWLLQDNGCANTVGMGDDEDMYLLNGH